MIIAAIALLSGPVAVPQSAAVAEIAVSDPTLRRLPPVGPREETRRPLHPYGRLAPSVLEMMSQVRPDPQFVEMDANGDGVVDPAEHEQWRRRTSEDAWFKMFGYRKSDAGAPCASLRALTGSVER